MSKLLNILGEYFFGTESFKKSKENEKFLNEFYPGLEGVLEAEEESERAFPAILYGKIFPDVWLIGGGIYLALGGSHNKELMIGLMSLGEIWRNVHSYFLGRTFSYIEKTKKEMLEQKKEIEVGKREKRNYLRNISN